MLTLLKPSFIYWLLCSPLILICNPTKAQNNSAGIVTGTVTSQQQPLPYITVNIYKAADTSLVKGTLTNENGNFEFSGLALGNYIIGIDAIGYIQTRTPNFTLSTAQPQKTLNTIVLQQATQQLKQVSVTAKKPLIERRNDKMIMNIAGSTLAAGNTVLQILAKAPGVTVDNEGNVNLGGKPGVSIMIDGKLTYLSGAQLANLLRATDGSTVQAIEIMSNPSARYDAAGTGGIINLKLKRSTAYGTNGTVTLGAGYGNYYKANGGVMFNNRSKHLNLYGNYNYTEDKSKETLLLKRSTTNGAQITYFDQQGLSVDLSKNNSYKAGADYYFDDNHVLGVMASGYRNTYTSAGQVNTAIGSSLAQPDSLVNAQNPGYNRSTNQTYNLNYKATIDTNGQELNIDADYTQVRNRQLTTYNNLFYNTAGIQYKLPFIFRNNMPADIHIATAKIDYVYPLSQKTKLETGAKSSYVNTDNNFTYESLEGSNWVNNTARSNRFTYKEHVNAAYGILNHSFTSTTLQVGLRAELTNSTGNSVTLQNVVKRSYLDFFPSLSVNQQMGTNHELGFSYSRRIDRPDYQSLNPFVYYADIYTLNQGNPALKPQYANSVELNYTYKKATNVALSYTRTTDVITTTLLTDTIAKTLLLYEQNLAARSTINLTISRPLTFTKWWTTSNNASVYYSKFKSPDLMGMPFSSGKTTFSVNTNQTFTITPTINAELAGNYTSSQVFGTYIAKPIYGVDLGVAKSFANKRANVKLAVSDLFNQQKISVRSAITQQDYRLLQKQETRVFRLTFTYNFGSSTVKAARERANSSSAEQSRIKGGN